MPALTGVTGYTSLTQQMRLALETGGTGESLLMPQTIGAASMSLTTQPNTISPTTGMHLHFFLIGNPTAGTVVVAGTGPGGAVTSITYHVNPAPQNNQGYSELTTKEAFLTVNASGITLTGGLIGAQIVVFGSFAGKYLIPSVFDKEEKITHFSPQDKRGILAKNLRVVQLAKIAEVGKLDSALYADSLWAWYMTIGNTPVITTAPGTPTNLLASTTIAATMTLTTPPVSPGEFLIFAITTNTTSGTIVVNGTDPFGNPYASAETIPFTNAATQTVYSSRRYSAVNTSGANTFTTTGGTSAHIAVTGVYAWIYTWIYDGINNLTPLSACLEVYDGVQGVVLPGTVLSDLTLAWEKEKEIALNAKATAQDFCIVGDPTGVSSGPGVNPFATISQPASMPYTSWPSTFYIDNGFGGVPFTTQDGSMRSFKFAITTGRKWVYSGSGFQRPDFPTWEAEPDWSVDASIVYQNWQNYVNYFKPNMPLILATTFQGTFLGAITNVNYYEQVQITLPAKIDTFKADQSKNPVEGTLKLMSNYDFQNLGFYYKVSVTAQQPPVYTN